MPESTAEKPKGPVKQAVAKQAEVQIGGIGRETISGASAGTGAPPLDNAAVARIQRSPQQALRSDILALQRTVGNRAVAAMVRGEAQDVAIQAKLEVGPVNDRYEREADHVARMVTSGITQRKPIANSKPKDEEHEANAPQAGVAMNIKRMVQRKHAESGVHADGSFSANDHIQTRIRRMEGGGRPLPDSVRREMEPRFGADFGSVRIHTGGEAVQLSREIGARAFTHGNHISFGAGGFNPTSQAGRKLLAHELTHTIQQTGASPLSSAQRSPEGTVQRGILDSVKNFFSRKKPEPMQISGPLPTGKAADIQGAALTKAQKAWDDAGTAISAATTEADQKVESHKSVDSDMESAGKTAKLDVAKEAVKGMQKGDEALKKFVVKYKQDLSDAREKISQNLALIVKNGQNMAHAAPGSAKRLAYESHGLAEEAAQLVEKIKEQVAGFGSKSDTEVAFARSGMTGRTLGYDARSMAAAEKSASDSVLDLLQIKGKVQNYFLYLDTDFKVLQGYTGNKLQSVSDNFSRTAAARAMASGMARAKAEGDPGMLSDEDAYSLGNGESAPPQPQEEGEESEQGGEQSSMEKLSEQESSERSGKPKESNANPQGPKPGKALAKNEKKFAKQIKRLEIRFMLYVKAQKRIVQAKEYHDKTEKLYTECHALYHKIDQARSGENHTPSMIDQATRDAGDVRAKVAQATVYLEKMRAYKKEVYDESQKYEKYVGKRAMGSGTRKVKKLVGMVGGAGLRALTGGMYRVEAEDEAGGYRVALKGRTILDDIVRKHFELKQILKGVNGQPVRGLGGKHGARAYVFFKAVAFGLQIIRDIASAVALWVTIVTAGTGAPVGAVFASLALYAGIAKAAIDLLLLIWSSVGLAKTNDPLSRMILRGENTRQGLAFGEGAFAGASAGLIMGLSGSTGLLNFDKQGMAFGAGSQTKDLSGSIEGHVANIGVGPAVPALGNIGQGVGVNALSPYVPHTTMTTQKFEEQSEKVRKAKKAIRYVANPARTAFVDLGKFAQKKKRLRQSKFVAILPELAKTIEEMGSTVEQTPERHPAQEPMPDRHPAQEPMPT